MCVAAGPEPAGIVPPDDAAPVANGLVDADPPFPGEPDEPLEESRLAAGFAFAVVEDPGPWVRWADVAPGDRETSGATINAPTATPTISAKTSGTATANGERRATGAQPAARRAPRICPQARARQREGTRSVVPAHRRQLDMRSLFVTAGPAIGEFYGRRSAGT